MNAVEKKLLSGMDVRSTAFQLACAINREHDIPVVPVVLTLDEIRKWQKCPLVKWSDVSGHPREIDWFRANTVAREVHATTHRAEDARLASLRDAGGEHAR